MSAKSLREVSVALAALVAALAVAYSLDMMVFWLRQYASREFNALPLMWIPTLADFALIALLAALGWWLVARTSPSGWIGLTYLFVGLLATLYVPLLFTFELSRFGLPAGGLRYISGHGSFWSHTGALLTLIDALHLLRRARADPSGLQDV